METRSADTFGARLPLTRRAASHVAVAGAIASVVAALALTAVIVQGIEPEKFGDVGLISALPPAIIVPFAILLASFVFCLGRMPRNTSIFVLHTVALIVMVYGIRAMAYDVPAFKVTYRHIGIAEVISSTGGIDPTIDAYFNWPGFFTLTAFLARVAGFSTIEPFAAWAPVAFNLLYLPPLLVIMRTVTRDAWVIWVAIWTFFLTDWIGQDYLSPQGLVFFLHLVVLALTLRWFTRRDDPALAYPPPVRSMAALLVVALIIVAFIIPSHQLTPFATIFALGAMLLARRLVARSLPALVIVMTGAWIVMQATNYISGHQQNVVGGIGDPGANLSSNVGVRLTGSVGRLFVVDLRLVSTAFVWIVAVIGAWRLHRNGRLDRAFAAAAVSAFPLLGLQSYGGEVILRVYLFVLPFAAYFVASAILPAAAGRRSAASPYIVFAFSLVALTVFAITRYGNERMDYFTKNEVTATRFVYSKAPPPNPPGISPRRNFLVLAGSDNLPWKAQRYDQCNCKTLVNLPLWDSMKSDTPDPASAIEGARKMMRGYRGRAYMIITRSEKAEVDLVASSPRGSLATFEAAVERSPHFTPIYTNPDAQVFVLSAQGQERGA